MMSKIPKPTEAELAILGVLWDRGTATVREVHDTLSRTQDTGYTTVLKFLQIMHEKGLVTRDTSQRSHVYAPAVAREAIQTNLVSELLDKAFEGSAQNLILRALAARPSTPEELDAIRAMIDTFQNNQKP